MGEFDAGGVCSEKSNKGKDALQCERKSDEQARKLILAVGDRHFDTLAPRRLAR